MNVWSGRNVLPLLVIPYCNTLIAQRQNDPADAEELRVGEAYVKRHTAKGVEVQKVWIRQPKAARK
jgi:hypothetical protein